MPFFFILFTSFARSRLADCGRFSPVGSHVRSLRTLARPRAVVASLPPSVVLVPASPAVGVLGWRLRAGYEIRTIEQRTHIVIFELMLFLTFAGGGGATCSGAVGSPSLPLFGWPRLPLVAASPSPPANPPPPSAGAPSCSASRWSACARRSPRAVFFRAPLLAFFGWLRPPFVAMAATAANRGANPPNPPHLWPWQRTFKTLPRPRKTKAKYQERTIMRSSTPA